MAMQFKENTFMRIDLHSHSNCSDGQFQPLELIQRAIEQNIGLFSITDHDTLEAYTLPDITPYLQPGTLQLITGIELSCEWQKKTIHLLGYNFDQNNLALNTFLEQQRILRNKRGLLISQALDRLKIHNTYEIAQTIAGSAPLCRPHFAQALIQLNQVKDQKQAFKQYLGKGKPGDQTICWPSLKQATKVIHEAGGFAVIAHPLKYGMTLTKLRKLLSDFSNDHGDGIEVCSGPTSLQDQNMLIHLAQKYELCMSIGSDFHHPNQSWIQLGMHQIPNELTRPVWEKFLFNNRFAL